MSKCPNRNDKEYRALSAVVGDGRAHTIYDMNNGNPVSLTADGTPSLIYQQLVDRHGIEKAIAMRSDMFTDRYKVLTSNDTVEPILDAHDNILLKDGTTIQLGDRVPQTQAIEDVKLQKQYVETAEKTNSFVRTLEKSIPGFNIQIESHDTVDILHKNDRAWVDDTGVHLNTQTMHYDTPIHEVTHLWIHALEMTDGMKYNLFMNKVTEAVKNNKEIIDTIKKKYPDLDATHQLYEFAAALSGMTSIKAVNKFMARNNRYVSPVRANEIYFREVDTVKTFYKDVNKVVSDHIIDGTEQSSLSDIDFETGTLNDIFEALTTDILNGNKVIDFGPEEVQQLLSTYYKDNNFEADRDYPSISNIKSIVPYLIGNDQIDTGDSTNKDEQERLVNKIYGDLYPRPTKKDKIYFDYGKMYRFPDSLPEGEIKKRIQDDMLTRRKQMMNSFNDNIVEILNKHIKDQYTPLEEIIAQTFSDYQFSDTVVDNIVRSIKLLGISEPMTRVLNYSTLKNDAELSVLYNDALVGYNPIVIQHTSSEGTVDVSIVDLTGSVLGFQDNMLEKHEKSLAKALGYTKSVNSDKKKIREFDMSNSQGSIRQILVATTIAGMNKLAIDNGKKLTIRRYGVIGFNGNSVQPYMLNSLHKAMINGRNLFTLPAIQTVMDPTSLSYNWFQELLNDDKAWDESNVYQSWRAKLETYYAAYYQTLGMNEIQKDSLMSNFNSYTHYKNLSDRARQIELRKTNWIDDAEHKLITQYKMWYEAGISINNGQVTDINKTLMKVTNVHNIKSDVLQNFSIQAEEVKSIIVNQVNDYKAQFNTLLRASLESRGQALNILGNLPKNVFGHLFKDGELVLTEDYKTYKKGQMVPVKLFNQLYGSYNLEEAKRHGLTKEDIAFSDHIIKTVQDRYVANILHENSKKSNPRPEAELRTETITNMVPGNIPIMDKTKMELLREGEFKKAYRKGWDQIAISEFMIGMEDVTMDNDLTNKDYQHLHSRFNSQMTIQQQLRTMGLRSTEETNRFEGKLNLYENHTMNLEYIHNVFVDDSIRTIEMENRLIPAMNTAVQWSQILKEEYNIQQQYTEQFLQEYTDRIMLGKSQDSPTDKTAAIVKNITNAYSYVALGYRPLVWIRSGYFNTQNQIIEGLATSATNRLLEDGQTLGFPTASELSKANMEIAMHHNKVMALGRKMGIVDGSEMEAIESFFTTNIDKNVFQAQLAHVGNYYTDRFARLVTMVGYMIHDGSYDAHTFNETTGELKYNKLLDKRYYKDGEFISDKEKAIWDRKTSKMIDSKLIPDTDHMEVGYDFQEVNTRMKWYADKFIIGAMDEYQKVLLGNTFSGRIFTQFRTFLPGKIFNLVGSTRMTGYGADITAELNENNEWETIKKQIRIEGTLASVWNLLSDVVKVVRTKDMKLSDIEAMDPMTKYNLVKSAIQSVFFISVLTGIYMLGSSMSDRDKDKLSWLYSELMAWKDYEAIKKNIIPVTGLIDTIMGIFTGKAWTQLLKYTGPVYDAIWFMELLGDNDNMMQDMTTRKVNDMNAKELQKHYEDVAQKRQLRLEKQAKEVDTNN